MFDELKDLPLALRYVIKDGSRLPGYEVEIVVDNGARDPDWLGLDETWDWMELLDSPPLQEDKRLEGLVPAGAAYAQHPI